MGFVFGSHHGLFPDTRGVRQVNRRKLCESILVIEKSNIGEYKVTTGNFVLSDKTKLLKEKIDKINALSKDELKDMYKFILNHQKISAKGGGGLGLVDIARKTGNKLNYTFEKYNDIYYFFNLDVFIDFA